MELEAPQNQQDTPTDEQMGGITKELTTVTTLSKYLALALFIILPFLGAYIGYTHAPMQIITLSAIEYLPAVDDTDETEEYNPLSFSWSTSSLVYEADYEVTFNPSDWQIDGSYFDSLHGPGMIEFTFINRTQPEQKGPQISFEMTDGTSLSEFVDQHRDSWYRHHDNFEPATVQGYDAYFLTDEQNDVSTLALIQLDSNTLMEVQEWSYPLAAFLDEIQIAPYTFGLEMSEEFQFSRDSFDNWQYFTSTRDGYSFRYPHEVLGASESQAQYDSGSGLLLSATLAPRDSMGIFASVETYDGSAEEAIIANFNRDENATIVEQTEVVIFGNTVDIVYAPESLGSDGDLSRQAYFQLSDDYTIIFSGPAQDYTEANDVETFTKILSSVRLDLDRRETSE